MSASARSKPPATARSRAASSWRRGARLVVDAQLGGALERRRGRGRAAARARVDRRPPRAPRRPPRRARPRRSPGATRAGAGPSTDVGERLVRGAPLGRAGGVVDRRAQQRVAELDAAGVEADDVGRLGGRRARSRSMPSCSSARVQDVDAARLHRADDGQRAARVLGQRVDLALERALDARPGRQRRGQRLAPGELRVATAGSGSRRARAGCRRRSRAAGWRPFGATPCGLLLEQRRARRRARGRATRRRGRPRSSARRPSPSRTPSSSTMPSASRRRAANSSASRDAASSQCTSSTIASTGCSSAAAPRTLSTAAGTAKRSCGDGSSIAIAPRSARACASGMRSSRSSSGVSRSSSPANGMSDSDS